mmetsp:Transcript_32227/g.52240  ORF Transcript_32227/g.52240 Transcript_32227/m.52240 type:complete len:134 (+) Transcript_32227:468-869(+)
MISIFKLLNLLVYPCTRSFKCVNVRRLLYIFVPCFAYHHDEHRQSSYCEKEKHPQCTSYKKTGTKEDHVLHLRSANVPPPLEETYIRPMFSKSFPPSHLFQGPPGGALRSTGFSISSSWEGYMLTAGHQWQSI